MSIKSVLFNQVRKCASQVTQGSKVLLCVIVLGFSVASAKNLSEAGANDFIRALCRNESRLTEFIDISDSQLCARLGIQYDGVNFKFLISQDLDTTKKAAINIGEQKPVLTISSLGGAFQRLDLYLPDMQYTHEFYFKNGKWILPSTYFSRNWRRFETEHFRFIISDSCMLLPYCAAQLEKFFKATADGMGYTQEQTETIKRNKIEYLLCRDTKEVATLTGYENRGMYELPSDRIITCFSAHYHELVHLMVNFKLRQLPVWTHPFLQEGIAVALGGRGGLDPPVVREMAVYLVESEIASIADLLSTAGFNQAHTSISYPISGLFSAFLLREIGPERFFNLYRKYSGSHEQISAMTIPMTDIPSDSQWRSFVVEIGQAHAIDLECSDSSFLDVYRDSQLVVSANERQLHFKVRGKALMGRNEDYRSLPSDVMEEWFGESRYQGEHYAIIASSEEIKIYNLYTGNLIANFVGVFRMRAESISNVGDFFQFCVDRDIFDADLIQQLAVEERK